MVILKSLEHIEKIRKACKLVSEGLELIIEKTKPGVATLELDRLAEEFTRDNKGIPAFKGYRGFPFTICSSRDSEVIHGFPSSNLLLEGQILSVDFGINLDGYFGDSAVTIPVGEVSIENLNLVLNGKSCLYRGITKAQNKNRLGAVSYEVQKCAEGCGYSIVKDYVGHGIGKNLHEPPQIPNYSISPSTGIVLKPGMVLAIEPMITAGSDVLEKDPDGWTIRTKDGKNAVHWEHTILVTESGPEVLTARKEELNDLRINGIIR